MKRQILISLILLSLVNLTMYGQTNSYPSSGSVILYDYNPTLILQRNTNDGGFVEGIQTKLQDGRDNWFFGALNQDSWIVSKGNYGSPSLTLLANGNLGMGTLTPTALLELNKSVGSLSLSIKRGINNIASIGSGTMSGEAYGILQLFHNNNAENVRIYSAGDSWLNGGNLGIGTTTPTALLELNKTVGALALALKRGSNNVVSIGSGTMGTEAYGVLQLYHSNSEQVRLYSAGDSWINGGNLGIGTDQPSAKLDVRGTIKACEVKVALAQGCDFVFKNDYKLMDLKELEGFVKTNQHLPEIASEKEMVENGVNMKELQMKLLQKIEELTLYTIEQNKKIMELEKQNAKIQTLEEEIEKLKAALK